jgi:hypothetical protein
VSRSEPSPINLSGNTGKQEVENCKEVSRSRERPAASAADETLGRRRPAQRASESEKRERGCKARAIALWLSQARNLGAGKPREASGTATWLIPRPVAGLHLVCESQAGRPLLRQRRNPKRGAASEKTYGTR